MPQHEGGVSLTFIILFSTVSSMSRQIYVVPDLCCIVSWRSVESVGGVFDPVANSAKAVFEHVKYELAVIPCLLLVTL